MVSADVQKESAEEAATDKRPNEESGCLGMFLTLVFIVILVLAYLAYVGLKDQSTNSLGNGDRVANTSSDTSLKWTFSAQQTWEKECSDALGPQEDCGYWADHFQDLGCSVPRALLTLDPNTEPDIPNSALEDLDSLDRWMRDWCNS